MPDTIAITITAPGLLTLETTGSTDTIGMLDDAITLVTLIAQAESGGSGGNFKMVVPVAGVAHTLTVDGQDTRESGAYTLDMDFKVAMALPSASVTIMPATGDPINIDPDSSPWATGVLTVAADDTTVQIQRRAADGNVADEDYFLFTPASSGLLTVNANDDNTAAPDANTSGTLFGAMGQGPSGWISGPGKLQRTTTAAPVGPISSLPSRLRGVKLSGEGGRERMGFTHWSLLSPLATNEQRTTKLRIRMLYPDPITLPHPSISGTLSA